MSPSISSATSSDTKLPGEARRTLVKRNMNSFSRHSMVDTVPPPNAASQSAALPSLAHTQGGKPSHGRSTSFLGFTFRGRTHSSPQQAATLPVLRETAANGSADEFGASRPSLSSSRTNSNTVPNSANTITSSSTNSNASTTPMGSAAQQQQQPQQQGQPGRQLHPEIRSIVQLSTAQAHKVYFSGPLVKHIERHPDGRIVGKDEPWREVWAQLGGTTLSVWDMKEIEEASRRGAEVPPSYLNVTDASINVLGAVTMPGPDGAPIKYANVVTLTNAGLNLTLFSCPAPQALISWTAALRLAAYEKSRLEEIYTAHLLRMSLSEQGVWKDPRSPLVNGRIEGWVKIRINGQTDWKRLWMVAYAGQNDGGGGAENAQKNRLSALFGRSHEHQSTGSNASQEYRPPHIVFYSSQRPRDQKRVLLTFTNVSQVFAVYPERPELISRSTLIKMEGYVGEEELAGEWRKREGWLLMMPEAEPGKMGSLEMLKWLVGLHDAFGLYGRPNGYSWNPRDPNSLMFAYPIGPRKDNLFLDRELVEPIDPREDRGSVIRQKFKGILIERMYGVDGSARSPSQSQTFSANAPPSLPPIQSVTENNGPGQQNGNAAGKNASSSFQLPPLSFDDTSAAPAPNEPSRGQPGDGSLSPITERSYEPSTRTSNQEHLVMRSPPSASSGASGSGGAALSASQSLRQNLTQPTIQEEGILGEQRVESPSSSATPYEDHNQQSLRISDQPSPEQQQQQQGQFRPQPLQQRSGSFGTTQSARPFSITSQESAGAAQLPRIASPPRDMRSPPLSTHSSQAAADPVSTRLPASTTSSTSAPTMDRALSPSSLSSMRISVTGSNQGANGRLDLDREQPPHSPGSHMSHSTMLTSPFSMVDVDNSGISSRLSISNDKDKDSLVEVDEDRPPPPPAKSPLRNAFDSQQLKQKVREPEYVFNEPGAMYYMNQQRQDGRNPLPPVPSTKVDDEDESTGSEDEDQSTNTPGRSQNGSMQQQQQPQQEALTIPSPPQQAPLSNVPPSPVHRRQTPMGFEVVSGHVGVGSSERPGSRERERTYNMPVPAHDPHLGRRPSGARAPPSRVTGKRFVPSDNTLSAMPLDTDELSYSQQQQQQQQQAQKAKMAETMVQSPPADVDEHTVDALAALSFLEQEDAPVNAPARTRAASSTSDQQKTSATVPQPPQILEPEDRAPSPPGAPGQQQYRSSFAPSKQAAERKARSQAQQAAHDAAVSKPGRPNGRQRTKQREGGWESSEDEEEEEEEEDDEEEDVASDRDQPAMPRTNSGPPPPLAAPVGRNPIQQQQMQQQVRGLSPSTSGSVQDMRDLQNQQRPLRTLPQIPRGRSPGGSDRRYPADQFQQYPQQQQFQQQQQQNAGPAHQNMWTANLERDPGMLPASQSSSNNRDTFVQIESPSETMTKAFTPQGLLSAGLQDKQDRSAKRQEELARETGASLINVPNKPPPPQVGLLGAITAHERDRKREGGMGATLTEREREKRMAEERQRRLDELQRQQLEQQQQFAAQYGGMGMYGGGLTPQMTGMNPMMSGYFPQMMGGPQSMYFNPMFPMMGNPQHMFAAQQAAQAYQQAMLAMSQAGSQIGGDGGNGATTPANGRTSPNANMGGMGTNSPPPMGGMGFDPRMSMVGMPMMSPMGMMGMGMPGMGMQGMGGPGSTMGGMDPRFSLGPGAFDGGGGSPSHPSQGLSSGQQSRGGNSYNNSPSPAASPAPQPNAPDGTRI